MEFVKNFTPSGFRVKNFTPLISPNFNSFSKKKHKKMSENGENYTAEKDFTLPPVVMALTNLTSALYPVPPPLLLDPSISFSNCSLS